MQGKPTKGHYRIPVMLQGRQSHGHGHLLLEGVLGGSRAAPSGGDHTATVQTVAQPLGTYPSTLETCVYAKLTRGHSQQPWPDGPDLEALGCPSAGEWTTEPWSTHTADTPPRYRDEPRSHSSRVRLKRFFLSDRARPTRPHIVCDTVFRKRKNCGNRKHVGGLGWGRHWPQGDREGNFQMMEVLL